MSETINKHVVCYECEICGNIMVKLVDGGVTPSCCGTEMQKMKATLSPTITADSCIR